MVNRHNIMIVEDDQDSRLLVSQILEREGFDVIIASDIPTALSMLDTLDLSMVILDVMLPEHRGFQIIDLIRRHSDIPLIMLSVEYDDKAVLKALGMGADDYVKKPFCAEVLKARILAKLRRVNIQA